MKRSIIFWNIIVLIIEFLIFCLIFNSITNAVVGLAFINSVFLFANIFDDNIEDFTLFLFVSFLGIFVMSLGLIIYLVGKLISSHWIGNSIIFIRYKFKKFNKWLDK